MRNDRPPSVLIVGMNYAPEPTGIARYTAGLAEMLSAAGSTVEVITGIPHYPSWRVDPQYRWRPRVRETHNGVPLHRLRHFVPARQSALRRAVWEASFTLNGWAVRPRRKPEVVISYTPCLGAGVLGARFARRHGAAFGVVVQDLTGQAAKQSGISGGGAVAGIASGLERWILQRADSVAIVSEGFRPQLREYRIRDERIYRFPNWTHIAAPNRGRATTRREFGWRDEQLVVLHTGNMGLKQGLDNVVECARLLADRDDIVFVLLGDGSQRDRLERESRGLPNVEFVEPVGDDMYPNVLDAADVFLVNELPDVGEMSLPSKLTSYLAAGRPVLAAVASSGAAARELTRSGGAAVLVEPGNARDLAAAVVRMSGLTDAGRASMGDRGRAYAEAELTAQAAAERATGWITSMTEPAAKRAT